LFIILKQDIQRKWPKLLKRVEDAPNRDLLEADAIILGSPSYFRLPAWPIKKFIDESIEIYGKLKGKVGGIKNSLTNP